MQARHIPNDFCTFKSSLKVRNNSLVEHTSTTFKYRLVSSIAAEEKLFLFVLANFWSVSSSLSETISPGLNFDGTAEKFRKNTNKILYNYSQASANVMSVAGEKSP